MLAELRHEDDVWPPPMRREPTRGTASAGSRSSSPGQPRRSMRGRRPWLANTAPTIRTIAPTRSNQGARLNNSHHTAISQRAGDAPKHADRSGIGRDNRGAEHDEQLDDGDDHSGPQPERLPRRQFVRVSDGHIGFFTSAVSVHAGGRVPRRGRPGRAASALLLARWRRVTAPHRASRMAWPIPWPCRGRSSGRGKAIEGPWRSLFSPGVWP